MNQDESHLDSLAIAHYVLGGLMALFACFPLLHVLFHHGLFGLRGLSVRHDPRCLYDHRAGEAFGEGALWAGVRVASTG